MGELRSGYNVQGANLNIYKQPYIDTYDTHTHTYNYMCMRLCGQMARGEETDPEDVILYVHVYTNIYTYG